VAEGHAAFADQAPCARHDLEVATFWSSVISTTTFGRGWGRAFGCRWRPASGSGAPIAGSAAETGRWAGACALRESADRGERPAARERTGNQHDGAPPARHPLRSAIRSAHSR
jgi:hypothetical protein